MPFHMTNHQSTPEINHRANERPGATGNNRETPLDD